MFGFLKEKLKSAISKFSKKVEEETEIKEEKTEKKPEEKKIETHEKEKKLKHEIKEHKPEKHKEEKKKEHEKKEEKIEKHKEKVEHRKEKEVIKEKIEKETKKEDVIEKADEKMPEEKKSFFGKLFHREEKKEEIKEKAEEIKKEVKEDIIEKVEETKPEEKRRFFGKVSDLVTKTTISEQKFDELFWDLELALLENNVAVEVIEKIKDDLKKTLVNEKLARGKIEDIIMKTLKSSIEDLFKVEKIDLIHNIKKKKPYVVVFVGVNGSGKTTNLVKFADLCMKNHLKPVLAACDTFRAAAIQQIEEHANKLGIKLIKHDYGSDAAAVAFDAIEHAKAKNLDVVLIDTAGRNHSNVNLMDELKKVIRVAKPDFIVFVGDSLTGNDAVEQAKTFNDSVGIDGIILTKTDVDDKGGAFISVSYVTKKPIIYVGTGQEYSDLKEFDSDIILKNLGF
jgi:fused signal recognition particle receptor